METAAVSHVHVYTEMSRVAMTRGNRVSISSPSVDASLAHCSVFLPGGERGIIIRCVNHRPIVSSSCDRAANVAIQKYGYVKATAAGRRRRRRLPGRKQKGYQHQGLDCFFFLRPIFPAGLPETCRYRR